MKIKSNAKGQYYAHLTGSNPVNLKTKNRTEAIKLAKAAKLEELEFAAKARLLTAEVVQRLSAGGRVTGTKAVDRWREIANGNAMTPSTMYSYESHINRFLTETRMFDKPISNATFKHIDGFVNAEDDSAAGTRNMRRASLDSFFTVCAAEGFTLGNPAGLVRVKMHQLSFDQKEPKTRLPFTPEELEKLHTVVEPFWRPAIRLAENYGLRLSDVAQLDWNSFINPDRVIIWTDKRDRRLVLPIVPAVVEAMAEVPRTHPSWVFPEQFEMAKDMKRRAGLSVQFGRILKRLEIHDKSFHCLRHTFASQRAALGDSVDEIREKMGHTSTQTTQGYLHP